MLAWSNIQQQEPKPLRLVVMSCAAFNQSLKKYANADINSGLSNHTNPPGVVVYLVLIISSVKREDLE